MADGASRQVRYTAFLSYSHRDSAAAQRLHKRLETYRLPRRLVGRETARGPVPARLWPIFRDRDELPAATDLSATVREALAESGALIVLCSPHAAASLWVAEEIRTFRELHPDRPILAAILDGDAPDCFPQALRDTGLDGIGHEPLAAELRRERDGAQLGLLKLVAGVAGVGLDDLVQRDANRRVRRVTAVTAAALVVMLVTIALALFAWDARREAERQRAAAEGQIEFMMTDLRTRLRGVGRLDIMTAVNQRALEFYAGQDLDALSAEALSQRARILHAMAEDDITLGNLDAAGVAAREAFRTTSALIEEAPDDAERIFVHAQSEYWAGRVDDLRDNDAAALAAYRRYHALAERMIRLAPDNARFAGEMAYAESNLGSAMSALDRQQDARQHFTRSLHWFNRAGQLEPDNREWLSELADAHAWMSDTWFAERRFAEARAERLEEQRLKDFLVQSDPANRAYLYATVITARALARIDKETRNFSSALAILNAVRPRMTALLAQDPDNLVWRHQAVKIEIDTAGLYDALADPTNRMVALRRAERLLSQATGPTVQSSNEHRRLVGAVATLITR